jgi:hypothetical protein
MGMEVKGRTIAVCPWIRRGPLSPGGYPVGANRNRYRVCFCMRANNGAASGLPRAAER